jgi:hypothetical protein
MRRGVIVLASLLAGCDSLADTNYVGEPMFRLTGTLVTATKDSPAAGGLALAWQDTGGAGGPGVATTVVPAKTGLATVQIAIPLPPPAAARFAFDDVELAEAFVLLVEDPDAPRPVSLGIARDRVVVFASGDVADGTQAADYLGGPITAGYHLRKVVQGAPGPSQQIMIDRCVLAGATPAACTTRRNYQLAPADDAEPVRIVVNR